MKESKLKIICKRKIVDIAINNDGIGIMFDGGVNLSVFNKYKLLGLALNEACLLLGNIVTDVEEEAIMISIRFSNECVLQIDMRDEAYTGPEAMMLYISESSIVVWN